MSQPHALSASRHGFGPAIDPRFQARMVAVQRSKARRRLRIVKGLGSAAVAIGALWGLSRSPLLAVRRIVVAGAWHTGRATALSVTGLDRSHQMLDLNPSLPRGRVRALPWVEDASVRRQWPTTVKIVVVVEGIPVAQVPGPDGGPAVVDVGRRVLAVGREASAVLARPRPAHPTRLSPSLWHRG